MGDAGYLGSLSKKELLRLAGELNLGVGPDQTREQLVTAIVEAGGVGLEHLTNAELVRLGQSRNRPVRTKMTKPELIAALSGTEGDGE